MGAPTRTASNETCSQGSRPADHAPDPPESLPGDPALGTRIGVGIRIKGTVSGDSDVYVDGEIEGTVTLPENALIVGPDGKVRARVKARLLTLWGHLEGKVRVTEKIEIRQSGLLLGDLPTATAPVVDSTPMWALPKTQRQRAAMTENGLGANV